MNAKLTKLGFLYSIGVLAYVTAVAFIIKNGERWFGQMNTASGPIAFLLLFTVSAAVVGALVFGQPAVLFFNGQKREGVTLALTTVGILVVETTVFFLILALTR